MVGAPKHKKVLLHQWGALKRYGMLLAVTDAASCSGMLLALGLSLAPGLFLSPRGAPGPGDALTPVVPVGEQQARRRELLTAASCSRKLSTSLCAASARCKRTEQESHQALQLIPPHTDSRICPSLCLS